MVLALVLALGGAEARAESEAPHADRWIPGFSFESGIRSLEADYSIDSSERGFFENDARPVFFFTGGGIHLATPVILNSDPQIRLFGRFGAATSFDGRFGATNEGAPGPLIVPVVDLNGDGIPDGEPFVNTIQGLGSSTQSRSEPLILSASLGADVLVEFWDRRIHVKPSLEWIWQEDQVVGLLGFAESMNLPPGDPNRCPCRTGFIRAEQIEDFQGIGPGLELELEASRIGPNLLTVFVGAKAFYALDTKVVLNASVPLSDNSRDINLRAVYKRDQWDYLFGFGFRLHWLPE